MKVKFESKGGFDNALAWLTRATNAHNSNTHIKNLANYGTARLSDGTPEDTGELARGWEHEITKGNGYIEVAWMNTAHPESEVNVATLVELGHGTRNGGYVAPKPYIKQSMAPVWKKLDNIVREMMR